MYHLDSYHPGELIVGVLKEIASSTVAGQELLCKVSTYIQQYGCRALIGSKQ